MLKSNRSVCISHTTYCKILLFFLLVKAKTNLVSGQSTLKIGSIMLRCTELILLLYCFCWEVLYLYLLALYHHDLIIFRKKWLTKNKKPGEKNHEPFTISTLHAAGLQIRVRIGKLFSLFLIRNICCGYSKEPSQLDGSFELPKHVFKLMGKKIIKILRK